MNKKQKVTLQPPTGSELSWLNRGDVGLSGGGLQIWSDSSALCVNNLTTPADGESNGALFYTQYSAGSGTAIPYETTMTMTTYI